MNSSLKAVVSAGLLAMLIVGCGSDGDSQNVSTSDIKGDWVEKCTLDGTTSTEIYFNFTDTAVSVQEVTYDNMTCSPVDSEILQDVTVNYNYILGDDFTTTLGKKTTKVDLTLTGFNLAKGQLSEQPIVGTKEYTIFYKENNKLYSGDYDNDHNGSSDATRPIVIDFTDPLEVK